MTTRTKTQPKPEQKPEPKFKTIVQEQFIRFVPEHKLTVLEAWCKKFTKGFKQSGFEFTFTNEEDKQNFDNAWNSR